MPSEGRFELANSRREEGKIISDEDRTSAGRDGAPRGGKSSTG